MYLVPEPRRLASRRQDLSTCGAGRESGALISCLSYRTLLLAVIAVVGACAATVLTRPAPEPGRTIRDDAGAGPFSLLGAPRADTLVLAGGLGRNPGLPCANHGA